MLRLHILYAKIGNVHIMEHMVSNGQKIKYPRAGTFSARIVECLEAETATSDEVAVYLSFDVLRVRKLLSRLQYKGVIRYLGPGGGQGKGQWGLVDPVSASLAYPTEENQTEK